MGSKGLAPYYRNYMFDAVKNYILKILPEQKTEWESDEEDDEA